MLRKEGDVRSSSLLLTLYDNHFCSLRRLGVSYLKIDRHLLRGVTVVLVHRKAMYTSLWSFVSSDRKQ